MTGKKELTKEDFLPLAKAFGLDINDPHIEELHAYVRKILPALKSIEELDLTDMEPWMPSPPPSSPAHLRQAQERGGRRDPSRGSGRLR